MSKRFKMKFTIPSFQMCRSDDLSSFPGNPVPAIYRLSPVNSKAHDIGYPDIHGTSPEQQCKVSSKTKKVKSKGRKSTSDVPSRKSEFLMDKINEEESESLISCLSRFSEDHKVHSSSSSGTMDSEVRSGPNYDNKTHLIGTDRRSICSVKKVERVRFQSTIENRRGVETNVMSSRMEEKVRESFALVKKSKDPYEDFKKSMLEMIEEMEMYEAKDLEQLLQCFLALNSRDYHGVIVRAFMEIWQQMFVWNPKSTKNLQTNVQSTDVEK
ncbi:unnamed protein product [Trifolium pratense]|uniref:Uncharacterized protein n=1 Tax=Trifolium pratense TaxID=57577 RepID=A0ACB0JHG1_TRIPR|nr:unnamed protein product [Trifolium pratense]